MLSKSHQEEFIDGETCDKAYDLIIIHQTSGYVIVIITALEEDTAVSITSLYERIATQIYAKHLQEIEANNIVWIERIIHQTSEEAFFKVDLLFDDKSNFFHSPQWRPCNPEIIFSIKKHCGEYVG